MFIWVGVCTYVIAGNCGIQMSLVNPLWLESREVVRPHIWIGAGDHTQVFQKNKECSEPSLPASPP